MSLINDGAIHRLLEGSLDLKWINNGDARDIAIRTTDSTFLRGSTHSEKTWGELLARAGETKIEDRALVRVEGSLFSGNEMVPTVYVSKGISYRDVVEFRRGNCIWEKYPSANNPSAYCVANILLTSDDMFLVGRRKFFGDWDLDKFELPGGFVMEENLSDGSLTSRIAQAKLHDDYGIVPEQILQIVPVALYNLPPIGEVQVLYLARTHLTFGEIKMKGSKAYSKIAAYANSQAGLEKMFCELLANMWHPPSLAAARLYRDNFYAIQKAAK